MSELPPDILLELHKKITESEQQLVEKLTARYTWIGIITAALLGVMTLLASEILQSTQRDALVSIAVTQKRLEEVQSSSEKLNELLSSQSRQIVASTAEFSSELGALKAKADDSVRRAGDLSTAIDQQQQQFRDTLSKFYSDYATLIRNSAAKNNPASIASDFAALQKSVSRLGTVVYIQYNNPSGRPDLSPSNQDFISALASALSRAGYAVPPAEWKSYVTQSANKLFYFNQARDQNAAEIVKIANEVASSQNMPTISPSPHYAYAARHRDGEMSLQLFLP
jgi:hypothetical protein